MIHQVRLNREAEADLIRLTDFMSEYGDAVATRCLDTIRRGLESLKEMPARHRMVRSAIRELYVPFGDSGYVIQYRVDADAVVIARIFHAREER